MRVIRDRPLQVPVFNDDDRIDSMPERLNNLDPKLHHRAEDGILPRSHCAYGAAICGRLDSVPVVDVLDPRCLDRDPLR